MIIAIAATLLPFVQILLPLYHHRKSWRKMQQDSMELIMESIKTLAPIGQVTFFTQMTVRACKQIADIKEKRKVDRSYRRYALDSINWHLKCVVESYMQQISPTLLLKATKEVTDSLSTWPEVYAIWYPYEKMIHKKCISTKRITTLAN